ncbi:2923_t:CDS:2, partial [Scutellospora calospora]
APPSTVPAQYMPITGPLLTQPLNIDNQSIGGDTKDRRESLSSQSGAPSSVQASLQPMMDSNFIQTAQPTFYPPPTYWHPQHMIMPPFSTGTSAPGYISAQQAWTTSVPKDSSGVSRIQPTQSTGVNCAANMSPAMPLEQQYVETPVTQHHYPSAPEQYQATSQPQEPNSESDTNIVSYLIEEQRKGLEATNLASDNTPPPTPSEAGSTTSSRSRRSSLPPRQRIRQPSVASMSPASSVSSLKPSSLNRYFILKSLTQDDLDISVKSGFWATQPHNEAALNKAFKSAENVYLIFSANKSGEFYGYAKMVSPISKETTETVQWTPIDEAALAASSSRPSPVQEDMKTRVKNSQDEDNDDCEDDGVPSRNWGTTFKVEWMKV